MAFYYHANNGRHLEAEGEPYGMFRGTYIGLRTETGTTHEGTQIFESEEIFRHKLRIWSLTIHWKYSFVSCERVPYPSEKPPEISFDI